MEPGVVGLPFIVTIRAVSEGLKTISDAVPGGPTGGVVYGFVSAA